MAVRYLAKDDRFDSYTQTPVWVVKATNSDSNNLLASLFYNFRAERDFVIAHNDPEPFESAFAFGRSSVMASTENRSLNNLFGY